MATTADEKLINRALELVRDGLRSGEIPAENFDMGLWFSIEHCKTVACIGGWVDLLLKRAGIPSWPVADEWNWSDELEALFVPNGYGVRLFTTSQAADAIDRYLAGQEPWPARREAA